MNLIKLFNFKYLKQNLKKSKGLLTLMILVIPVLTTLMLISLNNSRYDCAIEEIELLMINLFGMYIIPILLSIILSGYIYKKSSVDFINSMPLNRKTIYFTNFIGGLLIILVIQVLTLLASIICANVFTALFVPIGMIIDVFVMMLVSYIFVYSATMLASTLSGNILTQIVVTALILFLIPFTHFVFTIENGNINNLAIDYGEGIAVIEDIEPKTVYTQPFWFGTYALYGSDALVYNSTAIVKMLLLAIIYLILGMFLFEKRKMENLGTSFASLKVHYIVKALTMVPMIFLICLARAEIIYLVISLTIVFIYYILYDFILSKKVKLKYTISCFIISVLVLASVFHGGNYILSKISIPDKEISIDEIEGMEVSLWTTIPAYIEDKAMIKNILEDIKNTEQYYYNNTSFDMIEIETTDIYVEIEFVEIRIRLKNKKDIYTTARISRTLFDELTSMEKETKVYYDIIKNSESAIALNYKLLSKEVANRVLENIANIDDVSEIGTIYLQDIEVYYYDNHTLNSQHFSISINKEIFDIVTQELNRRTYEAINKEQGVVESCSAQTSIYVYDEYNNTYDTERVSFEVSKEFVDYVNKHYQENCDLKKSYIMVHIYGTVDEICYLNITQELLDIISRANIYYDGELVDVIEYVE